jgi:hypothetical protein
MSFITFDYKCPGCGWTEERLVRRDEADLQQCVECIGSHDGLYFMKRMPAGPKTTFRFADGPKKEVKNNAKTNPDNVPVLKVVK